MSQQIQINTSTWPEQQNGHHAAVGGFWDEIGQLQFNFMVDRGLQPHHRLLDFGCGSFRGGIHFIEHLESGNYCGVDKERNLLETGIEKELTPRRLLEKQPQIHVIDDCDLSALQPGQFDFALAQSVFTHLQPEQIQLCLTNIMRTLGPHGVFYATYFESLDGRLHPGPIHPFRRDETKSSYYPFDLFASLAEAAGLEVENIGEWNHPRGQKMLAFRHGQGADPSP